MTISPSRFYVPPSPADSRPTQPVDESAPQNTKVPGQVDDAKDKTNQLLQKQTPALGQTPESAFYNATIYGSTIATAPDTSLTVNERKQRIDAYANRVTAQINDIESGSEGERNVKFQNIRQFMEPPAYFSGGLLAAGYDPHEKFEVTFYHDTKKIGSSGGFSEPEKRTYAAWEIAAGRLAHDRVRARGPINYWFTEVKTADRGKVSELESLGNKLQTHWLKDIAAPMSDDSGKLANRSGRSDAYVVRGTLQSLVNDKQNLDHLSTEAQAAIKRTLETNGQVIMPNIYGYPLSGYAFIPYIPYDGNYEHRPNEGVMIDLRHGSIREIRGDNDFADWAKNNRSHLLKSFNAGDAQGGKDAHWPKASEVLDSLIDSNRATYPGYENFFKDQAIPVRETFNYTRARGGDYRLKYGSLNSGIASKYGIQNAKNALWKSQTEVFGPSQQRWKAASDVWNDTLAYVPVLGNAGNIVFGVNNAINGMTAEDRVGGAAGAVLSGLQLAHEIGTIGAGHQLSNVPAPALGNGDFSWKLNPQTSDLELVRTPATSSDDPIVSTASKAAPEVNPTPKAPDLFPGMREIEFNGRTYFAADKPDAGDGQHYVLRVRHPEDPSKLASSGIIAKPDETGTWHRRGVAGGARWPWQRSPTPAPSDELKTPPKISDGFEILGDAKKSGADKFDEVMNYNSETRYEESVSNFESGGITKQKLTVAWSVEENNFSVAPNEAATPNEHGATPYSQNFLKDLNRDRYTVVTKGSAGDVRVELDATGDASGETLQKRLQQFEEALPDPAMRSRISEVAHQGSVAPASVELKLNQLKDHIGFRGEGTHYTIVYDPATNTAEVRIAARIKLLDLDKDAAVIPDMEATAHRTLKIGESNELINDGNPFIVEKEAPFSLSVSSISDLK